jgi:hypothetical protein
MAVIITLAPLDANANPENPENPGHAPHFLFTDIMASGASH